MKKLLFLALLLLGSTGIRGGPASNSPPVLQLAMAPTRWVEASPVPEKKSALQAVKKERPDSGFENYVFESVLLSLRTEKEERVPLLDDVEIIMGETLSGRRMARDVYFYQWKKFADGRLVLGPGGMSVYPITLNGSGRDSYALTFTIRFRLK